MPSTTQLDHDHQPKPLTNGSDPDFSELDQTSPPSTEGSQKQLPQIPSTPPKYAGDPAELIIARMLDQQFAGGQHLMLSSDGRFGPGYVTPPTTDRTNGLRLST